jgi:hypothetical protein
MISTVKKRVFCEYLIFNHLVVSQKLHGYPVFIWKSNFLPCFKLIPRRNSTHIKCGPDDSCYLLS